MHPQIKVNCAYKPELFNKNASDSYMRESVTALLILGELIFDNL